MFKCTEKRISYFFSFAGGAFGILAFAPFDFTISLLIALSILFFQLDKAHNIKTALIHGYLWGLGFFITGLHWFAFALAIDIERFFWLIPFALLAIQGFLAIYILVFAGLYKIKFKYSILHVYFISICWTLLEWLRGNLFTGFPWILSGYCFSKHDEISQLASITGIYGLSFLIALLSSSIYGLVKYKNKIHSFNVSIILTILFIIYLYGSQKIHSQQLNDTAMPKVLLVQSGVLAHKPDKNYAFKTFLTHLELTKTHYKDEDLIIWSESSHPFLIDKAQHHFGDLFKFLQPDAKVIMGSPTVTTDATNREYYWNSMLIVNQQGQIENYYDKVHLVPFGEYIPFQSYLPNIDIITENMGSYSFKDKMSNIKLNKHDARPLICYEAIFSNHPEDRSSKAQFIINITNDNWYGDSIGPYQHFSMAKYRAIEHGVPLIRVAISGISAIFDSYGRVEKHIALSQKGVVSAILPQALKSKPFYSAELESVLITFLLLCAIIILLFDRVKMSVDKNVDKAQA
jgi:apolipoprotein N-acyltransferase